MMMSVMLKNSVHYKLLLNSIAKLYLFPNTAKIIIIFIAFWQGYQHF